MRKLAIRNVFCCLVLLAACDGKKNPDPVTPEPVPGELTLSLSTPHADDRALLFTLAGPGPITGVQASGFGYTVHARASGSSVRLAVFGRLANGPVVRFHVPDVEKAWLYAATLHEAADPQNALRSSMAGYALTVSR
jgi:hypothetical protein